MNGILQNRDFLPELQFSASRSSGPGGQNVNKVKDILLKKLKNRINSDGELIITVQADRSQLKNKEEAIEKFLELIAKALTPRKPRKSTRPTKASVEKRLETKKQLSEKKLFRRKIE